VRAGDTLWTLAAVQLGPLATDLEIAEHWPRWFQVNRAAIGNDPNLLLPGQILRAP
jgi:nucleoid-associated protein YgaU